MSFSQGYIKVTAIIMMIIGGIIVGMKLMSTINSSGTFTDLLASSASGIGSITLGLLFLVVANKKKV